MNLFTISVYYFLLIRMSSMREIVVLEIHLYQKEANIFCHSFALSGYSLTAQSFGKQTDTSEISSKAS